MEEKGPVGLVSKVGTGSGTPEPGKQYQRISCFLEASVGSLKDSFIENTWSQSHRHGKTHCPSQPLVSVADSIPPLLSVEVTVSLAGCTL